MNHSLTPLSVSLLAALAATVRAQDLTIPAHAALTDCHHSAGLPFGAPGFRTQFLVEAGAIAPTAAVLDGLRFRVDRSSVVDAASIPNVTVTLSHSTQSLGGVSDVFTNNVSEAPVVVFQGTVDLPANTGGNHGAMPFDIHLPFVQQFVYIASQGNLLIDIVGDNAADAFPSYWLDAAEPGGSVTHWGQMGDDPNGDSLYLSVASGTGLDLDPAQMVVGGTIYLFANRSFSQPAGLMGLSLTAMPAPLDLSSIGAPTNFLYIDPQALVPLSWTQTFIGFAAAVALPTPNDLSLVGTIVYAQSAVLEPAANPYGAITSGAVEVRLGDPFETMPVRQLDATDPNAVTGTLLDFSFGFGPARYGTAAFRLDGIFF